MDLKEIKKMIDHSLLHPLLTDKELTYGCLAAVEWDVAAVCIKPCYVREAKKLLQGSDVKLGTVAGFPHGVNSSEVKAFEVERSLAEGAEEIDMVINTGKLLSKDFLYVEKEIEAVNDLCRKAGAVLKVIFETDFITDELLKVELCNILNKIQVGYAKTSTGFGYTHQQNGFYSYKGAEIKDLLLFKDHLSHNIKIKAAGGIRTFQDFMKAYEAGATRIGLSKTKEIIEEAKAAGYN